MFRLFIVSVYSVIEVFCRCLCTRLWSLCWRRCLHCAKQRSLCFAVVFFDLLADKFSSAFSRGVSVENLPRRGFAATCCACSSVPFAWEIVRDSPMVNIVSQTTMNQHNSLSWIIHENAPWSSVAKSMLPGNAKCSITSLADSKHIFRERKIYLFIYGNSNFATG